MQYDKRSRHMFRVFCKRSEGKWNGGRKTAEVRKNGGNHMSTALKLLSLTMLLCCSYSAVEAQRSKPLSDAIVAEQLRQVESKRRLAGQELAQLEDRVEGEVRQVISRLDDLFRSDHLRQLFEKHHTEAEVILQNASLPDDVGALQVTLKKLKSVLPDSLASSQDLEELIQSFIADADRHLEPAREALQHDVSSLFEETLGAELKRAQEDIRKPFHEVLIRYFPIWREHGLIAPPLPDLPEQPATDSDIGGTGAIGALGVGSFFLFRREMTKTIIRRTVKRVVAKLTGRVASKALLALSVNTIPVIGQLASGALMIYDAAQIFRAKTKLERELRAQFAKTYAGDFTPDAFWESPYEEGAPSFRQEIERGVRSRLEAWSEHCRQEVARMLVS